MSPASTGTSLQETEVQLSLPLPDARRLRVVLPWLVRALEDRETPTPKLRERRREAHALMESLLANLAIALPPVESVSVVSETPPAT